MVAISRSDADGILKEYYAADGFHNAGYEENPFLGIAKKVKITGRHYDFAVKYGYGANRSRTAATALLKTNTRNDAQFQVTTCQSFDAHDVDKRALAEVSDEGAFVDLLTDTMDGLSKSLHNGLGEDLFIGLGAAIGKIGAVTTTTLTLANPTHVTRFYVGQTVRVATTDGTSGALEVGSVTITGIDSDLGKLTAAANWATGIPTIAANQFIFTDGDFGLGRAGLQSWCPDDTTGLGTAFYNVTRTADVNKLAGHRQSVATGADIISSLRTLIARMGRSEAAPDTCGLSFDMLSDIETQLESRVVYTDFKAQGVDMAFDAIKVTIAGRKLKMVPDRSCGDDRIYAVNAKYLEVIHSEEKPVVVDDADGEVLSRNAGAFSYDIRANSFSNFVMKVPREAGVLIFS
jgi:hypothetical protein